MATPPVIAIVDDDPSCRDIAEFVLRRGGMDTHVFATADEFLAWVTMVSCDCILLDANLPETSGDELQARLHEMGVGTPVLFITADADVAAARSLLGNGAADVIHRPIDPSTLLPKVFEAIHVKAA